MAENNLLVKLDAEPDAWKSQQDAKAAIMAGQNFGLTYLAAQVRSFQPYDNYQAPDSLEEFEFTVKGVIRLEMMASATYQGDRRLLGSMFTKRKSRERFAWRSRMLVQAFDSVEAINAFLEADPLNQWPAADSFTILPDDLDPDETTWLVLFQVHDVQMPNGRRFADILANFLSSESKMLRLLKRNDILPPV
jgi:hypothetical protein